MIRRIREMLRLQAQRIPVLIHLTVLAGDCSIKKVAGIKLNSRLVSPDLHHPPCRWFLNFRRLNKLSPATVEHKIVIVPLAELKLLMVIVDAGANGGKLTKIERSAFDRR